MEEQGMPERLAEVNSQNARLLLKLLEKDKEVRKLRRELEKKAQQDQLDLLCAQMESQLQLHEGWATPEPGAGSSVEGDRGSAPPAAAPAGGARRRSPLRRRPAGPAARQPRPRSEGRPPSLQGLMQVFKKFLEKPAAGSEPRMLRSGPSVSPRMHFSMKFSKAPLGCLNFHVLGFIDFFICGGSNLAAAYLRVSRVRPGPQDAAIPAPSSGAQGQGESCKSEPTPPEVAAAG